MAKYLGNRPTAVPLTSSDLEDSIITSAKILDGTIANADVNDISAVKITAGTMATARLGSGTASSSTILYGDQTYKTEPSGFDVSTITGATALGAEPAGTDEFILSDAGTLKRMDYSHIKKTAGIYTVVRSASFSDGDAYMEMTNAFNSTYTDYLVKLTNLKPDTDGADLQVKMGQSDGTYGSVFNWGVRQHTYSNTDSYYGGTNSSRFTPTFSMDNGAWHDCLIWFFRPMSTGDGHKTYYFSSSTKRYDEEFGATFGGGMAGVSAALPRLHVGVNSGAFDEGNVIVYGITNAGTV